MRVGLRFERNSLHRGENVAADAPGPATNRGVTFTFVESQDHVGGPPLPHGSDPSGRRALSKAILVPSWDQTGQLLRLSVVSGVSVPVPPAFATHTLIGVGTSHTYIPGFMFCSNRIFDVGDGDTGDAGAVTCGAEHCAALNAAITQQRRKDRMTARL